MDTTEEYWCSMEEITAHLGASRDTVLVWIEHIICPQQESAGCGNSKSAM